MDCDSAGLFGYTAAMHEAMTDEALMLAYRDGDAVAFESLYRRYRTRLFRYLQHQCGDARVAEELYQDIWLKVVGARVHYEVAAKFSTWLFRIAHNRLIDHYRSRKSDVERSFDVRAENDDDDPPYDAVSELPAPAIDRPDVQLDGRQLAARLLREIDALPPPQREAFLLSEEADMTLDDIAATTGVNRETAKSRLRYALTKLRSRLQDLK